MIDTNVLRCTLTQQIALMATVMLASSAFGQALSTPAYPTKVVRMIVPVSAGGLQDGVARALAPELSKAFGYSVIVENRAGASGIIAAEAVAKSAPDGYTLFMTNNATLMQDQFLRRGLSYDSAKDLSPVIALVQAGNVVVTSPEYPADSVQELIALARNKPGQLNYGSFGLGTAPHIDTEAISTMTGITLTHVPYKGGAGVLVAVASGEIAFSITGLPPALPLIRQKRLKALAYGGTQRSAALPDVPTLSEAGLTGFVSAAWFGLMVPSATPRSIVDKIAGDSSSIITRPEFRDKYIHGVGLEVLNLLPAAFAELLKADRERFGSRIKTLKIKID